MSLSLYDASIPGLIHMLRNLDKILDKAEAHAAAEGLDLATFTDAKLAADMRPFTAQIQMASDSAKGAGARLSGQTAPSFADTETTFPELKERIAKTVAYLETVKREDVEGDDERPIELKFPNGSMMFTAKNYLFQFVLPNFHFHVVTAYALLRAAGVPLGKRDYLGG